MSNRPKSVAERRKMNFRLSEISDKELARRQKTAAVTVSVAILLLAAHYVSGQGVAGQSAQNSNGAMPESKSFVTRDSHSKEPAALPANAIVSKMMVASARRSALLHGYRGTRSYHLQYRGILGTRDASMEVLATYTAPNQRNLSVVSQSGSKLLLNRVLLKLLESEREAYRTQKQVELSPANYEFQLLGTDRADTGNAAYMLGVKPRQDNKFLYKGKIWVDASDFAVIKMEGEPAKSPSFWIKDTQIDVSWEKVGDFWFTQRNVSVSHIRLGGTATLTIGYTDYQLTGGGLRPVPGQGQGQTPSLPDPSSVTPPH